MVNISNLPDGCLATDGDHPHLGGRQAQNGMVAFFGDQLGAAAGGPGQLRSFARFQFDIVDHRAQRNIGQTQAIARFDIGITGW